MPWREPEYPGEFPTLGYQVAEWVQAHCVVPDREEAGDPFVLTDEQLKILLFHYRVNPGAKQDRKSGRWQRVWAYDRGSQVRRPQKWGKAPLSAALACVEASPDGPVLFDGWDAAGEPVGRPWPTPHVQVTACSEDQTDNIWRVLLPMIQLGPLAELFEDVGLTRINLPTGGLIEPVTAAAISRLGQRVTLALQDQTESWVQSNGGWKLADNQRRGLAGTGGRFFETPNAHDPAESSVAQRTSEALDVGVYLDLAEPPAGSVRNKQERRKVLRSVYGDSTIEEGGWIDLDRIESEIDALLEHDPAQAERWFMNRTLASEGAAFDIVKWKTLAKPHTVAANEVVTLGVDGARHDDALAVIATHVRSGYQWNVCVIERPADADDEYKHDQSIVDQAVREVFDKYIVWRAYCDPQHIADLIAGWANDFPNKRVWEWQTYVPHKIGWAVRNFQEAIGRGDVTHDGDEVFTRHIGNARRRKLTVLDDKERQMHTLSKDSIKSPRKIDAAMAAVISWEARLDCIQAGAVFMGDVPEVPEPVAPEVWTPGRALPSELLVPASDGPPLGFMS